jgi:hypothetical protein
MRKVCFGHNIGTCGMFVELANHDGYKQITDIKYNEAQKLYHCIVEKKKQLFPFVINTKVIKMVIKSKICQWCNNEFIAKISSQCYCSPKCKQDYWNNHKRGNYKRKKIKGVKNEV